MKIILAMGEEEDAVREGRGEAATGLRRPFTLAQLERFISGKGVTTPA